MRGGLKFKREKNEEVQKSFLSTESSRYKSRCFIHNILSRNRLSKAIKSARAYRGVSEKNISLSHTKKEEENISVIKIKIKRRKSEVKEN
jgi:hypothetical protein